MPRIKFAVKTLEALLKRPHAVRADYFDEAMPGLCLRVGPKAATWYYLRRVDGRLVRLSLGTEPELAAAGAARRPAAASFTVARERAGKVESDVASGKHPRAEQARARAELRGSRASDEGRLLRRVAEAWAKLHFPTLAASTRRDYQRALDRLVAAFGEDDIGTLRRGQLIRHLDTERGSSPSGTAANRAAVVLRQLYAYARDRFDLDANPVADVRNPVKQARRSRTLDRAEIRVLWRACEAAGYPWGHALRFALCTGQRIGEVGNLRRNDVDSSGQYWIQTANKSDQRIDVHLARHARAILDDCPNFGRGAPFFSATGGKQGLRSDGWNNAKRRHLDKRLREAAEELGLHPIRKPWTPHDLRRTVRTALTGWCGVSPDTAERVLNHAIGGLRAVYDHADYRPHVADALQRWDAELGAILKGKAPTVVPLHQGKKRRAG